MSADMYCDCNRAGCFQCDIPSGTELIAGDRVNVRKHTSKPGKGLTYPTFTGALLDDAGVSEGWDVVDVRNGAGDVVSIYCFSIER
jgi:hypothetical protein